MPLQRSIQEVLAPSIRTNFDVGGRPPWKPLVAETIAQKGGDTDPLVRSGTLKSVASTLSIWHIGGGYLGDEGQAFVSDLGRAFYGEYHQRGTPDNMPPKREFLAIQAQDMDQIEEIFADWLEDRGASRGFDISRSTA